MIKNKNLMFIWVGLMVFSGVVQSAVNLIPRGSIATTQIFLPGQSPGPQDDTEVDVFFPNVGAQFSTAIVLQGGFVEGSQYSQFGRELARHGFVVAIPNRLAVFGPGAPPVPFPDQLVVLEALAQLEIENGDSASPLHELVDTQRLGLVGHSVGGFVGLLVVEGSCNPPFCFGFFQRPAALRAGAFYGTNSIDPASGQLIDIATGTTPVALVQGSLDGVSTPADAQASFEILDGPRSLITVQGANHFGITNENNPPGAIPDFSPPAISQTESIRQIAEAAGLFLRIHVNNESITFTARVDQDSWLKEAAPSDNFGAEKELPVKNKSGDSERAVYRFNLSDVPAQFNVVSATARFRVTTPDNQQIEVYRITDAWNEQSVNWNNTANNFDASAIRGSFTPRSDDAFVNVDLTSLLQDWVCGTPNHGLMFIATSNDEQSKYNSKEEDIASFRPTLEVVVGPGESLCD